MLVDELAEEGADSDIRNGETTSWRSLGWGSTRPVRRSGESIRENPAKQR